MDDRPHIPIEAETTRRSTPREVVAQIAEIVRREVPDAVVTIDDPIDEDMRHDLDVRLADRRWNLTCRSTPSDAPSGVLEISIEISIEIEIGISIVRGGLGAGPDLCVRDPTVAARILVALVRVG